MKQTNNQRAMQEKGSGRPNAKYVRIAEIDTNQLSLRDAILDFPGHMSVDIGALHYRHRDYRIRHIGQGCAVDLASFDVRRVKAIKNFVVHCQENLKLRKQGEYTVASSVVEFRKFIDWCDKNDHPEALVSISEAKAALLAYKIYMIEKYRKGDIKLITYERHLGVVLTSLATAHGVDEIVRGILNRSKNRSFEELSAPNVEDQGKLLVLFEMLFTGIAKFCLDHLPYPHKLEFPAYLNWPGNFAWILPTESVFHAPNKARPLNNRLTAYPKYFNYAEGRVANSDEIKASFSIPKYKLKTFILATIGAGENRIKEANEDKRHKYRLQIAIRGCDCFIMLFMAATGINLAVLRNLKWNNEEPTRADKQGFHEIKLRAKKKVVSVYLTAAYLRLFKIYLKLREFILGKGKNKFLFFGFSNFNVAKKPVQIYATRIHIFFKKLLMRLDADLPRIFSRGWRDVMTH